MAWAKCPTHGPIQDADEVIVGDEVVRLVCVCNLDCEPFEPQSFVEHEELVELAESGTQPRDAEPLGPEHEEDE